MSFNYQKTLRSHTITLRALKPEDFNQLYQVAADPKLWAGHPSPERYQQENFNRWFCKALESKQALVIIDNNNQNLIGSTRFYNYDPSKKEVFIGYTFIDRKYWGGQTNREIKELMLNHAFHFVDKVLFDVDPTNIRSQKALEKIGAIFSHKETKALSKVTEYLVYKINKKAESKNSA